MSNLIEHTDGTVAIKVTAQTVTQGAMDRLQEKQFTAAAQLRYRNKRGRWGVDKCPLLRLQAG